MDFSHDQERSPVKKFTGIALVILFHVFIVYALMTGLARKAIEVIQQQPIETKIIAEVKPPPPPDVPPPPPPPKRAAPPPPFIPPPEIQIAQPPQRNVIAAVSNVQPDNPVMPAPRAPVEAPPAPVAAPVKVAAVVDASACTKPAYPRNSIRASEEGVVTVAFLIGIDGTVVEAKVEKSSGFRDLDRAAVAGLSLCKFKPGTVDGKPEQSRTRMQYVWKLE
jgi:protein TonB